MPVTACDLLYARVLPFYEALGVSIGALLTDNGREFRGTEASHAISSCSPWKAPSIAPRACALHTPTASSSG